MIADEPMLPAIISPEFTPMPISSWTIPLAAQARFSSPSSLTMATAACTAWLACSASSSGALKSAITMSPTNLSTVPLWRNTISTIREKYSFNCRTSSSGSPRSVTVVNPRMSENNTVITRRLPPSSAWSGLAISCE